MNIGRRNFLKKSIVATAAVPFVMSLEEQALLGQTRPAPAKNPATPGPEAAQMPMGTVGKVKISRVICGGNLISGYAHSRDLIYVSELLKHYFSEEKIMATWALCEQHGINTMIATPTDPQAVAVYKKYRARGGRIQFIAQIGPDKDKPAAAVKAAADAGASGAVLVGNLGDLWTREGSVKAVGEVVKIIKDHGMIAGVAGHELRTPKMVEEAGIAPDFYMKTLHDTNYWSKRQPGQNAEVIDNYRYDNYWCLDPKETIRFMAELKRPWIAYKVLAAGAIHPRTGFRHAFQNGADFAVVGMFDFQVAENVKIARETLAEDLGRERAWMA